MKKIITHVLIAALGCAGAVEATAASLHLSWTPPTTRADGSALPQIELSSYEITLNGSAVASPAAPATSYTYPIAAGTCVKVADKFAIRVRDTGGLWSAYSPSVSITEDVCTPKANPSAPTLRVTAVP